MAISLLLLLLLIVPLSPTFSKPNATHAHTQHCLENEKTLLLELKNELVFNSSYSTRLVHWNQKEDCCSWEGVECDDAGHVIHLRLFDEGISGGLNESSSLFRLHYLEELSLAGNLFSGLLPHNITNLKRLSSLGLSYCNFSGAIPSTLGNLTQLVDLEMAYNFFSGSISSGHFEGFSKVEYIDLRYNSLSGSIPISIFSIPSLRWIYLQDNQLSGKVDEFAIVNISQLSILDLSSNRLESPIPNSFIKLQSLSYLYLSDNLFNDTFQMDKFLSLPNLVSLSLSNNNLSLFGSHSFAVNQSSLESLDLSNNLIAGEIPNWIWEIGNGALYDVNLSSNMLVGLQKPYQIPTSLRFLDLHSNHLRGEFPNLEGLSLSNNNFSVSGLLDLSDNMIAGEIPNWIWEIGNASLYFLNLSCNMLVGLQKPYHIPNSLQFLDLHSNQLQGEFPTLSLKHTTNVDFSNNQFDQFGILETGNETAVFGNSEFSLSNNSLSGSIPTFFCTAATFSTLDLSFNHLSGSIPRCLFENSVVLNLGGNNISGWIPHKISPSCQLMILDLSNNNLVGDVLDSMGNCRALWVLDLSNNKLSGTVPTSLCKALDLRSLDLSVNNLNGNIPRCVVGSHLVALNLGRNNITGRVPNFTAVCRLQSLDLNNNNLIGDVPQSLENCESLKVVNVGGNQLDGTFPCMLPSSLRVLVLHGNRFHGGLRCDKSWSNLQIFDIANNNFSGNVDPLNFSDWRTMMRDTVTKVSYEYLASKSAITDNFTLVGYIEKVSLIIKGMERNLVKIWPDFTSIDLSCNNFQGGIPDSLGLGALDLSVNQLTGKIPKEIAGLTFLQVMNVSHNKLVGEIPTGPQIQTFPGDCFEGNIGLCGLPLNISCIASPPNAKSDEKTEIEWDYVFAAAGYVVGFGSFLWVLIFRRSFRERYFEKIEDVYEKIVSLRKKKKRRVVGRRVVRNQARRH
ncbi:receptor-like protein 54 [Salvia splendens]|uniref:receptor-like protein 54 n=1 Tax=Salvia splendens TaxID=180675 RepID=UPI001C27D655|nr:receptor-like protein 54 [Salvia splendens]